MHIIGFCGSLRKDAWNRKLLLAFFDILPKDTTHELVEIGELPLFNQDLEAPGLFPRLATEMKEKIRAADGIIIASPEFNRSISAALKNMLEWTSWPTGDNAWPGKKTLLIGGSSGNIGTALSHYNLQQILLYLDARTMGQPEVFIGKIQEKFDEAGKFEETTKAFLEKAAARYMDFVQE
jgi:chromate reductase, NAD(P)H dehydrogenase (quinone)